MENIEIIIVLGNRLENNEMHLELQGRMDISIRLYHQILNSERNSDLLLLLSGGRTNPNVQISEANVMKRYAINNKIPESKIIVENRSLDTIGNGFFTRCAINELQNIQKIYIVSSCYHMNRAKYIFNMCYGNGFSLDFSHCYYLQKTGVEKKETMSLRLAYGFFSNMIPGDIESIEKRLFSNHELYNK